MNKEKMRKKIREFEKRWREGVLEDWESDDKNKDDEHARGFKDGAEWILDLIKEELLGLISDSRRIKG